MTSFSSINVPGPGKSDYRPNWQKQHIIPKQLLKSDALKDFFANLTLYQSYNNDEFETNGILVPSQDSIAQGEGFSMHRGSHPRYTNFVERILGFVFAETEASIAKGTQANLAYQEALKVVRGVQAFLMDGHVASIRVNDLTGESNA